MRAASISQPARSFRRSSVSSGLSSMSGSDNNRNGHLVLCFGKTMKTKPSSAVLVFILTVLAFLILMVPCASAWGGDRETVQLESQLEALQDQMMRMQLVFDEHIGS